VQREDAGRNGDAGRGSENVKRGGTSSHGDRRDWKQSDSQPWDRKDGGSIWSSTEHANTDWGRSSHVAARSDRERPRTESTGRLDSQLLQELLDGQREMARRQDELQAQMDELLKGQDALLGMLERPPPPREPVDDKPLPRKGRLQQERMQQQRGVSLHEAHEGSASRVARDHSATRPWRHESPLRGRSRSPLRQQPPPPKEGARLEPRSASRSPSQVQTLPRGGNFADSGEVGTISVSQRPTNTQNDVVWQAEVEIFTPSVTANGQRRTFTVRAPPRKAKEQAEEDAERLGEASVEGPKAVRQAASQLHNTRAAPGSQA